MGADVSSYVVLGLPITREMFFTTSKGNEYACSSGHAAPSVRPPPFCSQCGKPIRNIEAISVTEAVTRWAEKLGIDPIDMWGTLQSSSRDRSKFPEGQKGIGIHRISRIADSESSDGSFALGFKLLTQVGEGRFADDVNGIAISAVEGNYVLERVKFLERHALWMGWEKQLPVELFLTVYWSV